MKNIGLFYVSCCLILLLLILLPLLLFLCPGAKTKLIGLSKKGYKIVNGLKNMSGRIIGLSILC